MSVDIDKYCETKILDFFKSINLDVKITYSLVQNYMNKIESIFVKIDDIKSANRIANFTLTPMPGCCGIVISTNSRTNIQYRQLGIATFLNLIRIEISQEMGYGLLICTDVDNNEPQQKILTKNSWKKIEQFKNPRTQNLINIHTYQL